MVGPKKISIVAGELELPRLIKLFEPLLALGEVSVFAFNRSRLLESHRSGLKLRLFEPVSEMPGFMRGLDAELAGSDLVIGVESSRLSTFQALRFSLKSRCPFICFVTEHLPFMYAGYSNIRAIQEDVFRHSKHFWALSNAAVAALEREGVSLSRISRVAPQLDSVRFRPDSVRRQKFRNHIGISEECTVCLYSAPMVDSAKHLEVVRALDYVRRCGLDSFANLRVIFSGIGPLAQDIKYRCVDLGISRQVLFLHQDPEPFVQDLYAACDIVLAGPVEDCEQLHFGGAPLPILECALSGSVPIAVAGSVAGELLGDSVRTLTAFSYQYLGEALVSLMTDTGTERSLLYQENVGSLDVVNLKAGFSLEPAAIVASAQAVINESIDTSADQFGDYLAEIDKATKSGKEKDALVKIEDLLLRGVADVKEKAEVLRARGDALYSAGQYEEAMDSYSDAAHLDEKNAAALRGLGFVAWSSHSNEDALTFFRKALAINESDPRTLLGIGLVFRRISLYEESIFWLEKAVDHEEVRNTALSGLLQACSESAHPGVAIATLNRVMEVVGEKPALLVTLGHLLINAGHSDEGNRLIQRAAA